MLSCFCAPRSTSLPGYGICPGLVWQWWQGCISQGSALLGCCQNLVPGGSAGALLGRTAKTSLSLRSAQVLDARDPLRYRSEDLEAFAREAHAGKASLMLLNKADLLPQRLRAAWAAHFQRAGVDFLFWSAKAAAEQPGAPAPAAVSESTCLCMSRCCGVWQTDFLAWRCGPCLCPLYGLWSAAEAGCGCALCSDWIPLRWSCYSQRSSYRTWSTCFCCLIASWCAEGATDQSQPDAGTCTEVVSADRLVQLLHERAQAAVHAGSSVRALQVSCAPAVTDRCTVLQHADI